MMEKIFSWFKGLQQREQVILAGGAPLVVILLGYLWFWEPAMIERTKAQSQLQKERSFNQWLNQNAIELLSDRKGLTNQQSLATLVETTLLERSLSGYTQRIFKDSNDNTVVQLKEIPYLDFNDWIVSLQIEYSVTLLDAVITATERSGYVDVRLTMSDTLPPAGQ